MFGKKHQLMQYQPLYNNSPSEKPRLVGNNYKPVTTNPLLWPKPLSQPQREALYKELSLGQKALCLDLKNISDHDLIRGWMRS